MTASMTYKLPRRFDFSYHQEFERQTQALLQDFSQGQLVFDFSEVDYLDSAALGMLVMFHRRVQALPIELSICSAQGVAAEVIKIANLDQLYSVQW